jgi:hypothetical protein
MMKDFELRSSGALDAEVVTMRHATPEPVLVRWARRNSRKINAWLIAVPIFTVVYFGAQLVRWALT